MLETEPRDLLLDTRNDLVVGVDLSLSRGITGVMQECRIKMQMFQNEWFLNQDVGIPYFSQILGQKRDLAIAAAAAAFSQALLSVEDVVDILLMDVRYNGTTRGMTVSWKVRCLFGETPVDTLNV